MINNINQSINQTKHIRIAPYVVNESETHIIYVSYHIETEHYHTLLIISTLLNFSKYFTSLTKWLLRHWAKSYIHKVLLVRCKKIPGCCPPLKTSILKIFIGPQQYCCSFLFAFKFLLKKKRFASSLLCSSIFTLVLMGTIQYVTLF